MGINDGFLYNKPKVGSQKTEALDFINEVKRFAWCHQESNRGHKDFQSFALPTEL